MAKKTSSDLAAQIADLADDLQRLTVREVRTDLSNEIEDRFLKGRRVSSDDSVIEALTDFPTMKDPRLQGLRQRFENDGVSDDFRAGLLFALRLVGDQVYEY